RNGFIIRIAQRVVRVLKSHDKDRYKVATPRHSPPASRIAPAVRADLRCPNCGRETAVVFPLLPAGVKLEDAKIVCLACCPTGARDTEIALGGKASRPTAPVGEDVAPEQPRALHSNGEESAKPNLT